MRIPQIQIHQGFAKIDLNITRPTVDIEQKPAELDITQKPAELSIERQEGSINIDTTEARANMDLKSIKRRISDFADYARQQVLEGISSRISDGEQLGHIENQAESVSSVAREHLFEQKEPYHVPYNPNYIQIEVIPDSLKIEWKTNKPEIHATQHKPSINYSPGKVSTYIKQKNWITIDYPVLDQKI